MGFCFNIIRRGIRAKNPLSPFNYFSNLGVRFMKKLLLFLIMFSTASTLFCANKYTNKPNFAINYTADSESVLTAGTTALFNIYLTSVNTTGTTTGRFTRYTSSFTLEQLNSGGGATTNYFNVLLSTSDSIFDIINRINVITNWTASISVGCYGLQYATGAASIRIDGEGTTDGMQYDIGGKANNISTGSANGITIYSNGTTVISRYFSAPETNESISFTQIESSAPAKNITMYIYSGPTSTCTTTLENCPVSTNIRTYPDDSPCKLPVGKAAEFRVELSTWGTSSDYTFSNKKIDK